MVASPPERFVAAARIDVSRRPPHVSIQQGFAAGAGIIFLKGSLIMLQMMMGAKVYETSEFKQTMDSHYFPQARMLESVEFLKNREDIDIATMQFGQYQPLLAPVAVQANQSPKFWWREVGLARMSLARQPNKEPVFKGDTGFVPLTMCDRLDASVRKCFNSDPPICMNVNVTQKAKDDPDPSEHAIELQWDYDTAGEPSFLNLTMVCPYVPAKIPNY